MKLNLFIFSAFFVLLYNENITVFIIIIFFSVSACASHLKECIIQSHKEWIEAPLLRLYFSKSAFM
jgi:hypothetical protein